jgi:hypothetical protein
VIIHRRSFLLGLSAMFAAPAIVRFESLMPVRSMRFTGPPLELIGVDGAVIKLEVTDFLGAQNDDLLLHKILGSAIVYVR